MNKTKVQVYKEVLRDIFQNFEGVERYFIFIDFLCFHSYSKMLTFPSHEK